MTRTLFLGKCKKSKCKRDSGYIFLATLVLLGTVAGFLGILTGFEKVQTRMTERKAEVFYEKLEENNLKMLAEAKNEVV